MPNGDGRFDKSVDRIWDKFETLEVKMNEINNRLTVEESKTVELGPKMNTIMKTLGDMKDSMIAQTAKMEVATTQKASWKSWAMGIVGVVCAALILKYVG